VRTAHDLRGAGKIILPGVGAFGAGMQKLHEQTSSTHPRCGAGGHSSRHLGMQFLSSK
jgi:imidazoleglycerol phosphate synthase glutamine amidotransferase subunit HisH